MANVPQYFQGKLRVLNSNKIQWKIVALYFMAVTVYMLILYLVSNVMNSTSENPMPLYPSQQGRTVIYPPQLLILNLVYSSVWSALSGLFLVLLSWFSAVKFLKVPKDAISVPALINIFFFSKLTAWLIGLPLILIGWFAAVPHLLSPSVGSFTVGLNFRVITPLYSWIVALVYCTLLVTGIVFAVQSKKEKTIE